MQREVSLSKVPEGIYAIEAFKSFLSVGMSAAGAKSSLKVPIAYRLSASLELSP